MATMVGPRVSVARFQAPLYTYQAPHDDGFLKTPGPVWCCNERWVPEFNTIGAVYPAAAPIHAPLPLPYYHGRLYSPSPPPVPIPPYQPLPHSPMLPFSMPWTQPWPAELSPTAAAFGVPYGRSWTPDASANRRTSRRTKSDFSRGWGTGKAKMEPLMGSAAHGQHLRRNSWCGVDARGNNSRSGRSGRPKSPGMARAEDARARVPRWQRALLAKNKTSKQNCTEVKSETPCSPWGASSADPLTVDSTSPVAVGAQPCTTHGAGRNDREFDLEPDTSNDLQAPVNPLSEYKYIDSEGLNLMPARGGSARKTAGPSVALPRCLRNMLALAQSGLERRLTPELTKNGTGGAYIMRSSTGTPVAVLKPEDEEPCAQNNPRGRGTTPSGEGLKKGVRPGEGAVREVAAYLLDHDHFAGVPPTVLVCCRSKNKQSAGHGCGRQGAGGIHKVGSLQMFVSSDADCEEMGPAAFPVHEVHKICVLDMRLANADRNGSNILARQRVDGGWELTPIDHGYCLPDTFEDICFEWKYWRQAKLPFDRETLEYIAELNAEEDIRTLEAQGVTLRDGCKQVFRTCTSLLKKGAARGLTPYEISNIMCREGFEPSPLETLFKVASAVYKTEGLGAGATGPTGVSGNFVSDEDLLITAVDAQIDRYLDNEALRKQTNH